MVAVSPTAGNLHLVHWTTPSAEADGMAQHIVANWHAHPDDEHLVMVSRRQFGYALRDQIAAIDKDTRIDLAFSEGLLETWAVRETFLLFCLLLDPDPPTWRAWFAYKDVTTERGFKAPQRNAGSYLRLLDSASDKITTRTLEALVKEPRQRMRGDGGSVLWDRAVRFLKLQQEFEWDSDNAAGMLLDCFDSARWVRPDTIDGETARLDMALLLERAMSLLVAAQDLRPKATGTEHLQMVASRLRQHIATREPFAGEEEFDIQVATLWGAKGVTADHVYVIGACDEAIPGERRDEYPGTDMDFFEEQRRLFYVSITRAKRTLVISRPTQVTRGEALRLGLAVDPRSFNIDLRMTRFLRDILPLLPTSVAGAEWDGCVA